MASDPDTPTEKDPSDESNKDASDARNERWGLELPWLDPQEPEHPKEPNTVVRSPGTPGGEAEEVPVDQDEEAGKIPKSRVGRSAKLGAAIGGQATRYAGTAASNLGRSEERKQERLETRHVESALKMVSVLGEMKGAAMKIGQMASFIDIDFLPPEYREIYQEQLSKLRSDAPAMPWDRVSEVLEEEYEGQPLERFFSSFDEEATAAASIGQVHRATLRDGTDVAVKVQYPGVAEALESDLANAGILVRVAKALAPGLDAKAIAGEIRERVLEELDYEFEAQNQRSFARAYHDHPFIYVPQVHSRLSRRRVLVSDWVEGHGFEHVRSLPQDERDIFGEIVFRFCYGSIHHLRHFNADTHPGNYLLMEDGRVAFLDFGMTKRLSESQIVLEQRAIDAATRDDADRLLEALDDLGFLHNPKRIDAERLMDHVRLVGGWYLEDRELEITPERVMKMIEVTSDPRSEFFDILRKEALPADELMGRRMETGLLAVLAQLRATANWHRMMREWVYADPPSTVLGEAEWRYFAKRGTSRTPGLAPPTKA
ncbi:MAG: AarF/ABC1/UbiB kinase family protein [Actinomycetota bacterium]|nr:AarF/ABC1/UbiB kinase family protein [Actinomycetota bacterium]